MKKKLLSALMAGVMVFSLTACGSGSSAEAKSASSEAAATTASESAASGDASHIYVLTAPEDHGWTGSVATFAKEKVEEVNCAGKYSAEVITCDDASYQINQIEDIIAKGEKNISVVIQPIDDTVQSAIQELVDAGVPYVAFDRIIDGIASSAVSNVKGDNEGIGAGSAAYFVSLGLKPGDKVYVYEGDTSSVTTLRNQGFIEYLLGDIEFDGQKIADDAKWTQDQIDSSITYSGAMNWSRSDTKAAFETLMGDSSNTDIKWFYAEDDELAMGILEALNGGGIDDAAKEAFLANKPVITGCGGLDEFYGVLRGESYGDLYSKLGGFMSVTYSPSMIQTAIQDMVDSLDGSTVTQDHVIECQNVTADNVSEFKGFN
ncbi:MAG: substrate-binding domain-containing protein [Lachnospiraceae bacterium]|nr:substrate-binding domain-containing protein [Lachnospiraceae bacterium]